MSIYDVRDKPAYTFNPNFRPSDDNPMILKWWSPAHDNLLAASISQQQWVWDCGIERLIVAITPPEIIHQWRTEDPVCSQRAWLGVLRSFAVSRAHRLGLLKNIRTPEWRVCPLCNQKFVEDSLPFPLVRRLGIDRLDFCAPCLTATLFGSGSEVASPEDVQQYLRGLSEVLGRIPSQDFGDGMGDLRDLTTEERLSVLTELRQRPSQKRVKELFGSWFHALIAAGLLENEARRLTRGTQCLARDGHVCLSLGEKTIDDVLHANGIQHKKEPSYPEGNFRADFVANDVFIEYFGLTGDHDYDLKTREKQRLCKKHGIKLVSIYPADLVSSKKLEAMLLKALSPLI